MINSSIVRISVVFCENWIWRLADGVQAVFSGLFLFKIAAPFGKKSPHNTFYCIMQAVFMQALRQTPGVCCLSDNPSNFFTRCAFWPSRIQRICRHPARQAGKCSFALRHKEAADPWGMLWWGTRTVIKTGTIKDSANKLDPPDQLVGLIAFYLLILHLLAIQYGVER